MASKLPYTVEKTYTFKGQPYPTEQAALQAAVEQALGNPGIATTVLRECCTLAPLLARACDLGMGTQPPVREP